MGGDYYDREVYVTAPSADSSSRSSASQGGFSKQAEKAMRDDADLHKSCNPARFSEDMLEVENRNPIICALDVTPSMDNWPKIVYDKLPMFYGQIMMRTFTNSSILT